MRGLVEKLQHEIDTFIEQREALFLLVEARHEDAPLVCKLLTEVEKSNQTDVFLVLVANFDGPEQYATAAAEHLMSQHRAVCEELARQGQPLLPPLPADLAAPRVPPGQRMQAVLRAARSLLPEDGGHRLVYILWPMAVAEPLQFVAFVESLLPTASLPGWASGTRLIVRELPGASHEIGKLLSPRRTQRIGCDFSPAALKRTMEEVVDDPAQPEAERMQSLLMLATLDHAEERPAAALAKYQQLLAYYDKTQNPTMQAVVLNHMGEVYHRTQELTEARRCYEAALVPAEQSPIPLIILLLARNLGDVAFLEGRYTDAVECYTQWRLVADRLEDHQGHVIALQKLGLANERLGARTEAIACYQAAAELCRAHDIPGLDREHLVPLQKLYEQRGQLVEARGVGRELEQRGALR